MKGSRVQTLLAIVVVGIGVLIAAGVGGFLYVSSTPPLHTGTPDVPAAAGVAPSPEWRATVDAAREIVRAGVVEQNLPGLSVAVGVGDTLVWTEGMGWADLDSRTPVTSDTRFRLGTASVPLTSAAAGVLVEQHRLDLDATIQTYVPAFPAMPWPVTVRQLMGHTSGLRNDGGDEGPLYGRHCDGPTDGLDAFAGSDLRFEPGTQYRYSSFGWILVSAAVEAVAGESFSTFMRRHVFEPLGMHETKVDAAEPVPTQATSYFPRFSADPRYGPDPMRPIDYSCYAGASAFVSTPADLVRFGMALRQGRFLKPETVRLLQTSQRLPSGEETGYGLGWDVETVDLAGASATWVGHEGTLLGGMAASLVVFPDRGIVIAVVSNTSYADTESLAVRMAQAFVTAKK